MALPSCSYSYSDAKLNPLIDAQLETLLPLNLDPIDTGPGSSGLGLLDKLPFELLLPMLENLPLISLICFRNTSRLAHSVVDNMSKFEIIVQQAPQAIRGILGVQKKVRVSLLDLFRKLQQRHCDHCNGVAQHLWLPTTSRLCFRCAFHGPIPLEKEDLMEMYGLKTEDIAGIPSFRFLPATFVCGYDTQAFRVPNEHILYDAEPAWNLFLMRLGTDTQLCDIEDPSLIVFVQKTIRNNARAIKRHGPSPEIKEPVDLPDNLLPRCCRRSMATVFAPWISSQGAEAGVFCTMCLHTSKQDVMYTPRDFDEHVESCRVQEFDEVQIFRRRIISTEWVRQFLRTSSLGTMWDRLVLAAA